MINGGPLHFFLRQDMRSQILELVRQCGFKYVRISNIFSDSRMLKNSVGYSDYNFNELDQVLDFFVENNIRPYIQLCNRAYFVYRNLKKVLAYENNFDLIHFINENPQIIDKLVSHLLFRYGRSEVSRWYIEFEGCGTIYEEEPAQDYFHTFRHVYQCFKTKIPDIRVGAPDFPRITITKIWKKPFLPGKSLGACRILYPCTFTCMKPRTPSLLKTPVPTAAIKI